MDMVDKDMLDMEAELQYTSWWDGSGMKFEMGGMDPTFTFHSCASPINPTWFSSVQNESYTKVVKFSLVSLPQFFKSWIFKIVTQVNMVTKQKLLQ